ncbi:hypothetical protein JKY72_01605 [Candidatus Gracilibacteria bacterium]|nr:hypothetical protein [Candidatus Gracilibacteria bacterium]
MDIDSGDDLDEKLEDPTPDDTLEVLKVKYNKKRARFTSVICNLQASMRTFSHFLTDKYLTDKRVDWFDAGDTSENPVPSKVTDDLGETYNEKRARLNLAIERLQQKIQSIEAYIESQIPIVMS